MHGFKFKVNNLIKALQKKNLSQETFSSELPVEFLSHKRSSFVALKSIPFSQMQSSWFSCPVLVVLQAGIAAAAAAGSNTT